MTNDGASKRSSCWRARSWPSPDVAEARPVGAACAEEFAKAAPERGLRTGSQKSCDTESVKVELHHVLWSTNRT